MCLDAGMDGFLSKLVRTCFLVSACCEGKPPPSSPSFFVYLPARMGAGVNGVLSKPVR